MRIQILLATIVVVAMAMVDCKALDKIHKEKGKKVVEFSQSFCFPIERQSKINKRHGRYSMVKTILIAGKVLQSFSTLF